MNFIKKSGRLFLSKIMEGQVKRLRSRHNFLIIAVVGSVGKTSSKLAIAQVLGTSLRVRYQEGNYNDRLTVPLVIFGHQNPGIFDLTSWLKIIWENNRQISGDFPYDAVVVELGTDGPGQIKDFAYLEPEISLVSAITPEHMEFFGTLDAVAEEELAVSGFSKKLIINTDDTDPKYLGGLEFISYGLNNDADYKISDLKVMDDLSQEFLVSRRQGKKMRLSTGLVGVQGAKVASAAFAVGNELDLSDTVLFDGVKSIKAFNGRMNLLEGINSSVIIDDSYNSSPAAVFAALDVLYAMNAPQKIAVLGNMNELGRTSKKSHIEIGKYCDPKQLDMVLTIGPDANTHTAKAAEQAGCKVFVFDSPYKIGEFLKNKIDKGGVILVKGSQNRVFAEEAIKSLLKNKSDQSSLVRQTEYWLKIKQDQFLGGN